MKSVNKVILVGKIAADPECDATKNGARTTFPVATERDFAFNGDKKKVTDYHRVVAWGELAEKCGSSLDAGDSVYVEGSVINRAYEHHGERRFVTEIHAEHVSWLSFRKHGDAAVPVLEPIDERGGE